MSFHSMTFVTLVGITTTSLTTSVPIYACQGTPPRKEVVASKYISVCISDFDATIGGRSVFTPTELVAKLSRLDSNTHLVLRIERLKFPSTAYDYIKTNNFKISSFGQGDSKTCVN